MLSISKLVLLLILSNTLLQSKETLYKMSDCFGKTRYMKLNPDTIVSIEPANCTDKDGIKVFRIITKNYKFHPYLMNAQELSSVLNSDEMIKRDMKAQEMQMFRKELLLDY